MKFAHSSSTTTLSKFVYFLPKQCLRFYLGGFGENGQKSEKSPSKNRCNFFVCWSIFTIDTSKDGKLSPLYDMLSSRTHSCRIRALSSKNRFFDTPEVAKIAADILPYFFLGDLIFHMRRAASESFFVCACTTYP